MVYAGFPPRFYGEGGASVGRNIFCLKSLFYIYFHFVFFIYFSLSLGVRCNKYFCWCKDIFKVEKLFALTNNTPTEKNTLYTPLTIFSPSIDRWLCVVVIVVSSILSYLFIFYFDLFPVSSTPEAAPKERL